MPSVHDKLMNEVMQKAQGGSRRGDIWNQYWETLGQIDDTKTQVNNRFDNYDTPFGYKETSNKLNDLYNLRLGDINKNFSQDVAKGTQDATGRMASQGITGGSVLNDMLSGIRNNGAIRRDSNINNLNQIFTNADLNAMQTENQNQFQNTMAAQNTDFRNIANTLQKLGLRMGGTNAMSNYLNNWEQMDMQQSQQPGFLEDLFSGIGGIASLASIPLTGGMSLGGYALGNLIGNP